MDQLVEIISVLVIQQEQLRLNTDYLTTKTNKLRGDIHMTKDTVTINYNGEKFEIKKIPLRRFPALAAALGSIPEVIADVFINDDGGARDVNTSIMLEKFPSVFLQASETVPSLLAVISDIELEKILEGGLDDLIVLLKGILEINNIETIIKHVKNFMPTR